MSWYKRANPIDLKTKLFSLRPLLAQAAQQVYNEWEVMPGQELDDELNGGGICHIIAEKLAEVIDSNIPGVSVMTIDSQGMGDQHVWTVAWDENNLDYPGAYHVDISPYTYETGGGYNWKKIPNVVFSANDISITYSRERPDSEY